MTHNGLFLTFEGGDGAGKSSILEKVYAYLQQEGFDVIQTREPGGSLLGEEVRNLLLLKNKIHVSARAELLLFLAARAQHVEEVILPALLEGKIVLCDRFNDSTLAYQGHGRGFGSELVDTLCSFSSSGLEPDRTLLFDLDPKIGLQRVLKARKKDSTSGSYDRIEEEKMEFHLAIRDAYLQLAQKHPKRICVINAADQFSIVYQKAIDAILELLKK